MTVGSSTSRNFSSRSSSLGGGERLGVRSFTGDNDPFGKGMFAGTVRSSSSFALSYRGLVPLDLDALIEGLSTVLSCG